MADQHGTGTAEALNVPAYTGSSFREVREQLLSDPYPALPGHKVTIGSMFKAGKNLLLRDSGTILDKEADLVPPMQKLVHALGICLFGKWRITENTDYTGCFRSGVEHLILVRCSIQLSQPESGKRRGFGFAGKIFPTLDPNQKVKTANFITIDDLGGTFAKRFTDVALTNQPPTSVGFGLIPFAFVFANLLLTFRLTDTNAGFRPLYGLSQCGLPPGEAAKGPTWMQIKLADGMEKSDAKDFRDELRVANYKDGRLRFSISTTSEKSPDGKLQFRRIGEIELTEDVCSESADHRIRFHHNPNRGHESA